MRERYCNGDDVMLVANGCDGCSIISVNGRVVHEQGCPEAWRDELRECKECGGRFYPEVRHDAYCSESCAGIEPV